MYLSNKFENLFYSGGETTETSSDDEGPLQNIPAAQPQIQQPQRRPRYAKRVNIYQVLFIIYVCKNLKIAI